MVLSLLFYASGLQTGAVAEAVAKGAFAKMSAGFVPLVSRGILCNILICLAVWCGFRVKNESAKILMCFWCLFAFITTGFEHSIANMTLLTSALLVPAGQAVSVNGGHPRQHHRRCGLCGAALLHRFEKALNTFLCQLTQKSPQLPAGRCGDFIACVLSSAFCYLL